MPPIHGPQPRKINTVSPPGPNISPPPAILPVQETNTVAVSVSNIAPPPPIRPDYGTDTVESLTRKIRELEAQSGISPPPAPQPPTPKRKSPPIDQSQHTLRIPQARVLYALTDEEGDRRIMLKEELSVALGYSSISGTTNRVLYGIPENSKTGAPHPGLLQLGLIEELELDIDGSSRSNQAGNRPIFHYRITDKGQAALTAWLQSHELPELRDKNLCKNLRYQENP